MKRRVRLLVIGLGNELLMDDGVGVHAVRELQRTGVQGAVVAEVGVALLDALPLLEKADRVLAIDAMRAGGVPGTIYRFGPDDVAVQDCSASLHELGLIQALQLLERTSPPEVVVLGVEPHTIDYGMELTPSVCAGVPEVVAAARSIVATWLQEHP
jgi:hydrogenase maturation protease